MTFELALKENGDVRFQYLDTDFGNATWNAGASATAGLERTDGVVGRQLSFNQPTLTNGRAVSCTFGAPPPSAAPAASRSRRRACRAGRWAWPTPRRSRRPAARRRTRGRSTRARFPPGLGLDPATGAVHGTPTTAGSSPSWRRSPTARHRSDTQELSVTVAPPPRPDHDDEPPGGTVGVAYDQTLPATGGTPPYAWSLECGSLPPGLALNAATGAVTGRRRRAAPLLHGEGGRCRIADRHAATLDRGHRPDARDRVAERDHDPERLVPLGDGSEPRAPTTTRTTRSTRPTRGRGRPTGTARFTGVTNSLTNLRVSYVGKSSRSCTQTLSICRWSRAGAARSRSTVGTTEVAVLDLAPTGTHANYVSGSSGNGEVRVRVRCRTSSGSFFTSGDLLQISTRDRRELRRGSGQRLEYGSDSTSARTRSGFPLTVTHLKSRSTIRW